MDPICLAFLWHQHQPFYKDPVTNRYVLPWVRLHAIKDYIGLPLVVRQFPEIRVNINLVPSLILQIQAYADGGAEDDNLRLTRKPADDLTHEDRVYLLTHFFCANPDMLIRPFTRYNELLEMRQADALTPEQALPKFSTADIRDLQVWATLAWFHPLVIESDTALKELRQKGRDFTEHDKAAMLERQTEVIRRVLPLHRALLESGQIEISTTPFYHPILPLLCNMESAREAMPNVPLPEHRTDLRPDADTQITRAIAFHQRCLGAPPTGMWPSEGSVSMDILPLLEGRGLNWIATDEGILQRSADVRLQRDANGNLEAPDELYQPYALPGDGDLPAVVFRDRVLSDAIGFEYHHRQMSDAIDNFISRLSEAARRCSGRPRLIAVILDGENPWDYYPEAGFPFLRALYGRLAREESIATTRLSDYLLQNPPQRKLSRLAAGSWIDANFAVWIGSDEDRIAWSHIAAARETVTRKASQGSLDPTAIEQACEAVLTAEGSDWYWWFGSDRTSHQDAVFDALFRSYLKAAYAAVGEQPPAALDVPVGKSHAGMARTQPTGLLNVTLDGRVTHDDEWAAAAHYTVPSQAGAMRRSGTEIIRSVHYGFSNHGFIFRLDADGLLSERLDDTMQIAVQFTHPAGIRLTCDRLAQDSPELSVLDANGATIANPHSLALGEILEAECPLSLLAAQPGNEIEFFLEITRAGECLQRTPRDGALRMALPETGGAAASGT